MFQHGIPSTCARVVLTGAYGFGMVTATATLIALSHPGPEPWRSEAGMPTRAEAVMQQARQRALVSPKAALWAGNELHERRDF